MSEATSLAQDAIALLLDLAERGEIDPWDVRVIDAIDRHLRPLIPSPDLEAASNAVGRSPYGADLSRSGQGFLYASMLLLLKADALVEAEFRADDPELDPNFELDAWDHSDDPNTLPLQLEKTLRRRAVAPPPRKRPVTLQEMIQQIQLMEKTLADTPRPARSPRSLKPSSKQAARQIGQLAHAENLTETADDIDLFLSENWPQLSQGEPWIDFDRLVAAWSPQAPTSPDSSASTPHPSPAHHHVGTFWALLLLASQSRVELQQTEFYGELKLRPIDPALVVSAS
ncbi:MAG: segregation/condensation protein A [Oscillatoriales cyanobacterium]|nr:MAG: segregation/condensation protein A [Oscillatoriales cyanobacterium]